MRTGVVATVMVGLILAAAPASADTGLTFGPVRQLIEPDDGQAAIFVDNPTTDEVAVTTSTWAFVDEGWVEQDVPGLVAPRGFTLAPGEQREVRVGTAAPSNVPCRLVGIGFSVMAPTDTGVAARGVGIAQLAIQGAGGTESDCAALLPQPPPEPAAGVKIPWTIIGVGLGALVLFLGGRLSRRSKPKAYGF